MEHAKWSALADKIAEELFVMDGAEIMQEANEARRVFGQHRARRSQDYLRLCHDAGAALIALEKLGYSLVPRDA